MKKLFTILTISILCSFKPSEDIPTLAIGSPAPDFNLKGVDGKMYSLKSFAKSKILMIVFTCNHCPTAQAYEERINKISADYQAKGVQVVAISPNSSIAVRLDEMGYTDLGDTYEEMKIRAKDAKIKFPYLFDGETEITSKKYGPIATPHVFIFDEKRILRYSGRIDEMEKPSKTPTQFDARNALENLLAGQKVAVEKESWEKEPVALETIGEEGVKKLLKNDTGKLLLINVWATWCGPCVAEIPDFLKINQMYRHRDFEFVTVSADKPDKKEKALATLKRLHSATKNYIFDSDDIYKLIELIDPKWQGALPYTLLVEPNGKIVYQKQGAINPQAMKRLIVENPLIGRYF
jgi:peroxiredoxin